MAFCKRLGVLALLGLLVGCGLDKQAATTQIQSALKNNESRFGVNTGRLSEHCVLFVKDGRESEFGTKPQENTHAIIAMKAGYVTITPDGKDYWKITLTDKGKAAEDVGWSRRPVPSINQLRGCDYRYTGFVLAHPELVRVTEITGESSLPFVGFEVKWIPTELGAAMRENGAVYSHLNSLQKIGLHAIGGPLLPLEVPIPVPPEGQTTTEKAIFQRNAVGWRPVSLKEGRD